MPRVKRGKTHLKRRKNILKQTKGYGWGRKKLIKHAKEAILHAGQNARVGRRVKKRANRRTWQTQINAGARVNGISYSRLMGSLRKEKIEIDRKVLSELAANHPKVFAEIVKIAQK